MKELIKIRGARVHNLQNINVDIPLNKITCIGGPSGSGKSTLAFHTLFKESQRRYINSLPKILKFFGERPVAVDVDEITPVLPAFALPQHNPILTSRINGGDLMGLTPRLERLFYHFALATCPTHSLPLIKKPLEEQLQLILKSKNIAPDDVLHALIPAWAYPPEREKRTLLMRSFSQEFQELRDFQESDEFYEVFKLKGERVSLFERKASELGLLGKDFSFSLWSSQKKELIPLNFKTELTCPICDYTLKKSVGLENFSAYNALGACPTCNGHGAILAYDPNKLVPNKKLSVKEEGIYLLKFKRFEYLTPKFIQEIEKQGFSAKLPLEKQPAKFWKILNEGSGKWPGTNQLLAFLEKEKYKKNIRIYLRGLQKEELCPLCEGVRLAPLVHNFRLLGQGLPYKDVLQLTVDELRDYLVDMGKVGQKENPFFWNLFESILKQIGVTSSIGLGHLQINRRARTLSAGEYQRCLLVKYLSYQGEGSLFIFDEPSLGLGPAEQARLFEAIRKIQEMGNTIILVDHALYFQKTADYLILMGPGAGGGGGKVMFKGHPSEKTWAKEIIEVPRLPRKLASGKQEWIVAKGASYLKLPPMNLKLPSEAITWVHGPCGSGKTSYYINALANHLALQVDGEALTDQMGDVQELSYPETIQSVAFINAGEGKMSSRSTVGTATGLVHFLRNHFLQVDISRLWGLKEGHFSPNSDLGRCESCEGRGEKVIEMQFMEDLTLTCDECKGMKLNPRYAKIRDQRFSFHEASTLPMNQVVPFLKLTPKYLRIWEYLQILNLDYLALDRTLDNLSGGEKQRISLLMHLQSGLKNSVLFFENLSFGLSQADLVRMGEFLQRLVNMGNTLVLIDPHPMFQSLAHYTVDLGPGKKQFEAIPTRTNPEVPEITTNLQ